MGLFAKNLWLGMPLRSDVHISNMPFSGAKPKIGDIVKLTDAGCVEVTTSNTDRAYGVVTFYDSEHVCAVVTSGHVLARLESPTVGESSFVSLDVIRQMNALDENGSLIQGYEVKVG